MQCHDQIAADGVATLLVDERGLPFTLSAFSAYFGQALNRQTDITERVVPRMLRYSFCTEANEGGIPDDHKWDVAAILGHHPQMWGR